MRAGSSQECPDVASCRKVLDMIWVILVVLGIPLWLIAIALILLLRGRHQLKGIHGAVLCKPRVVSGELPGLKPRFARFSSVGHWVHDVFVLHGGNPFLTRVTLCGIESMEGVPSDVPPDSGKRMDHPVAVRFRGDAGATVELVCSRSDLGQLLGPFTGAAQRAHP